MPDADTEQGRQALAGGDYASAIRLFTAAIERNPHDAAAYRGRGTAFLARELLRVAVDDLSQALRFDSSDAEAVRQRAEAYFGLADYSRAMADCRLAIRLDPRSPVGYRIFGLAYLATEDYASAIPYLTQAVAIDESLRAELAPKVAEAYDQWGLLFNAQADRQQRDWAYREAEKWDERYVRMHLERMNEEADVWPTGPHWRAAKEHYDLGCRLIDQGKWQDAVVELQSAVDADGAYAAAFRKLGEAYLKTGRRANAVASLKEAIGLNPDAAEAHYWLGLAYVDGGFPDTAIKCFGTAIRLDRRFAEAYCQRGRAHWMMKNTYDAVRDCTEAFLSSPRFPEPHEAEAHFWRARAYLTETEYDRAIVDLEHARRLGLDPALDEHVDDYLAQAFMGRGLKHLRTDSWQEAIDGFDRAIQIDSALYGELNQRLADAYRGLGLEHAEYWRLEEAESSLKKAIEYDLWNAENHEALGGVYLKWLKWDQAAEHLRRAVGLDPENFFWLRRKLSLAYFRWAIDQQQAGRTDEANDLFNKARQWGLPLLEQPTRPVRDSSAS